MAFLDLVCQSCMSFSRRSDHFQHCCVFILFRENKKEPCTLKGKEIFELARKGEDPIARKTLDFFLKLYGEFISNWAINLMPQGGIYLTGMSILEADNNDVVKGGMTAGVHDEISREDGPFMVLQTVLLWSNTFDI